MPLVSTPIQRLKDGRNTRRKWTDAIRPNKREKEKPKCADSLLRESARRRKKRDCKKKPKPRDLLSSRPLIEIGKLTN